MFDQIKTTMKSSSHTLIGDMIGGAALMITLIGGLHLPALF